MGPSLYSQTPGAFHAGGGYSNPFDYTMGMGSGGIYGQGGLGNALGGFATKMPGHMLTAGAVASMLPMGGMVGGIGKTLGFGGLGMAASLPLSLVAGGLASQFAAGHQQNVMGRSTMRKVFGERDMGGRFGMGTSREGLQGYTSAFRQLANSAEMLTNDQELNNLVNKFSDMKLLETSRSVSEMASRVKKLSKTVREISFDLGTTLEGAMPDVQRHAAMGFMDPDEMRQSIRTNRALRGAGIVMSDSTINGLEMSQAMTNFTAGGTRKKGAQGAQRILGQASVATSMGLITDEDLMDATGKRGEAAVADFSQQAMQASRNVMNSGYGRNLAAFLGETDDSGRYTGKTDQKLRSRMRSMSMSEINSVANKKLAKGAVSFERQMGRGMGSNMSTELAGGEFAEMLDKIFASHGKNEDEIMIILRDLTGMKDRSLSLLRKFHDNQDEISKETQKRVQKSGISRRLQSAAERNLTFSGKLDRAYRGYIKEPIFTPIQEAASATDTWVGKYGDNFGRQMMMHGVLGGLGRALGGRGMHGGGKTSTVGSRMDMVNQGFDIDASSVTGEVSADMRPSVDSSEYAQSLTGVVGDREQARLASSTRLNEEAGLFRSTTRTGMFGKQGITGSQEKGMTGEMSGNAKELMLDALRSAGEGASISEIMTAVRNRSRRSYEDRDALSEIEQKGGVFAAITRMKRDKSIKGEGDTARVKGAHTGIRQQVEIETLSGSAEEIQHTLSERRSELSDLIQVGGWGDGFQTSKFGMGNVFHQVENQFMFDLGKDEGNYGKLLAVNDMLLDERIIRMIKSDSKDSDTGKRTAALLKRYIPNLDFTEAEGEQAQTLFKKIREFPGTAKQFVKKWEGGAGSGIRKTLLGTKGTDNKYRGGLLAAEKGSRMVGFAEDVVGSGLDAEDSEAATAGIGLMTKGDYAGASRMFDKLTPDDLEKMGDSTLKEMLRSRSELTKGGMEEIRKRLKSKVGKDRLAKADDLSEMKALATEVATAETNVVGSGTDAKLALMSNSTATESLKLIKELTGIMRTTQIGTAQFAKDLTNYSKELDHRIQGR